MRPTPTFEKWIPLDKVTQSYDVDNVYYGKAGITFSLIPDGPGVHEHYPKLLLTWEDILSYKISKEEYCPEHWAQSPDSAWTFYVSKASPYLDEFKSTSELFPEDSIHFLLIGTNLIADVLATNYPAVSFK